ncbi:MAG: GntR family transcriptional regulator [Acidobacteria bacterium]|nr:GntR family transcriptional regulator [Acidobacteriota bacterium]
MSHCSFKIVNDCDLSIYEQIKSQIISSLYTGKIQEGDQLPSVRELAVEAGVNHKTIHKIYRRLQAENYIQLIPGKGVFVKKRAEEDFSHLRREALLTLFRQTQEKASLLGLNAEKFTQLFLRYCTGHDVKPLACILVDDEEEILAFSGELQRKLKVHLYPVRLDELADRLDEGNPEIDAFKYILTTSWHLEQVQPYAERLRKSVLEIKPAPRIYQEIVTLLQRRNVGIIVRDMSTIHTSFDVFMNIFYPSTSRKFIITPVDNEELVARIGREADVVYSSPFCWNEVRQNIPADKELRTFTDLISDDFIAHLKMLQLFE